jgi:hypothetical protein
MIREASTSFIDCCLFPASYRAKSWRSHTIQSKYLCFLQQGTLIRRLQQPLSARYSSQRPPKSRSLYICFASRPDDPLDSFPSADNSSEWLVIDMQQFISAAVEPSSHFDTMGKKVGSTS